MLLARDDLCDRERAETLIAETGADAANSASSQQPRCESSRLSSPAPARDRARRHGPLGPWGRKTALSEEELRGELVGANSR